MVLLCLCCFQQALADSWNILPGRANDIAIGANGQLWAIGNTPTGGGFTIHRWTGAAWEAVDGGGVRIAVDPKGVPWVLNDAGQIWKRDGSRWIAIPGAANDIGIGANGDVWIISRTPVRSGGFAIQKLQTSASGGFLSWQTIDGGATRISVGPSGQPWVVDAGGNIHERKGNQWDRKPGAGRDIAVGANGVVWAIGNNPVGGGSFGIHRWDGHSRWDAVDGGGTQIAVDHFGRPIVTNHLGEIHRRVYTPNTLSTTPRVSAVNMNYNAAGRISAICVNPNDPNHIIAGGESGGLFETTNARSNARRWRHLSNFFQDSITDILMLPVTGGTEVYVTTCNSFENTNTPMIWKRDIRGNWSKAAFSPGFTVSLANASAFRLVKHKTNNTLYAAGRFGVASKPEGSDTWRVIGRPPGSGVTALETMADGTLIAGAITGAISGVFYSTNNGSSWIPAACPVPLPNFSNPFTQRSGLQADAAGQIALICRYTGTGVQLFASSDNGRNWSPFQGQWGTTWVATRAGGAAGGTEFVLPVFNPGRSRLEIYVSNGENLFYGYSSGSTIQAALNSALNNPAFPWQPGPAFAGGVGFNTGHEDTRQVMFLQGAPIKMATTSDGGLSVQDVTGDNPETFPPVLENANTGLNALQIYNMSGNGRELYLGTQDNSYGYNSAGDGIKWNLGGGREGFILSQQGVGYDNPWALFGLGNSFGKANGYDFDAKDFSRVNECSPAGNPDRWNSPTPGVGRPIWFGSGIYIQDDGPDARGGFRWKITYDNGCNWQNLPNSTWQRDDSEKTFFSSSANSPFHLIVPMNRGDTIVLGRFQNPLDRDPTNIWRYPLMVGLDGGIARVGEQFLRNPVFAVSPSDPQHILACEASTGKLKMSRNGGDTWTDVANFTTAYSDRDRYLLKNANGAFAIVSVEFSPFDPNIVLVGTVTRGLFLSRDGGGTWSRLNYDGIFKPMDFYWKSPREVFVATYGRGLFRIDF